MADSVARSRQKSWFILLFHTHLHFAPVPCKTSGKRKCPFLSLQLPTPAFSWFKFRRKTFSQIMSGKFFLPIWGQSNQITHRERERFRVRKTEWHFSVKTMCCLDSSNVSFGGFRGTKHYVSLTILQHPLSIPSASNLTHPIFLDSRALGLVRTWSC